eukprot:TRINITY_DN4879_c0_g1_i2.p2 TRINITY_DN4879_c0_g1~~TRINITY_DN4879_c0_g1_i2.p2  ORF type:complete len:139 (-),score=23.30 TRINITY_DN4879_c0_g1_i2:354-770(-)
MNPKEFLEKNGKKMAIAGGISGAVAYVGFGEQGTVDIYGVKVPVAAVFAAIGAAGALAGDVVHDQILPNSKQDEKLKKLESAAVGIGGTAAANIAAAKVLFNTPNNNLLNLLALSAVSFVGTEYAYQNYGVPTKFDLF